MRVSTLMLWILAICLTLGASREVAVAGHAQDHSWLAAVRISFSFGLLITMWALALDLVLTTLMPASFADELWTLWPVFLMAMGGSVASVVLVRYMMYGFA